MELLASFVLGMITGAAGIVSLTFYLGKRALDKKKAEVEQNTKKLSVSDRMKRVKDITAEQLDLARRADGPQKNSLDGKYKNGLIREMKRLDEEKNAVLKSILADGHDPELTTMDETGVVTKMLLSEYMAHMGIKMDPKPVKPQVEQVGKFTVIRGGRDDGGNNTSH